MAQLGYSVTICLWHYSLPCQSLKGAGASIGRNAGAMADAGRYNSAEEFIGKMDAGKLDRNLQEEMGKLSQEQRSEVARILVEREKRRHDPGGR